MRERALPAPPSCSAYIPLSSLYAQARGGKEEGKEERERERRREGQERLAESWKEKREGKCEWSARHNRRNVSRSLVFLPRCLPLTSTNTNFVGSPCPPPPPPLLFPGPPRAQPPLLGVHFNAIYHCRIFPRRFGERQRRSGELRGRGRDNSMDFSSLSKEGGRKGGERKGERKERKGKGGRTTASISRA